MKKILSTGFNTRQYMQTGNFEIFYYHDVNLNHILAHSHKYYEFYFFLEGDVIYQIENKQYRLQYGDCLLIPPGYSHQPHVLSPDAPYRRFVLWFDEQYYEKLCGFCTDFNYGFGLAQNQKRFHIRPDYVTAQEIQGKLMELLEETKGSHPFKDMSAVLMAASLLLHINRITYDMVNQISPTYENVLYLNVCDYINNHLDEDLSLDKLSAFFYVSKYHISHIFKDNMGISPHQYILKKRLQASKNGILTGIPLHHVYQQYGFNDYTSFYRAFKKEFGLSPRDYKAQHKSLEEYLD